MPKGEPMGVDAVEECDLQPPRPDFQHGNEGGNGSISKGGIAQLEASISDEPNP